MDLSAKTKTALDEVRMLVLGSQILLGFAMQAPFRERFTALPEVARQLAAPAVLLMATTIALLVAPALWHGLIEQREASRSGVARLTRMANLALAPFAASLGLSLYIAGTQLLGAGGALGFAAIGALLALALWYGATLSLRGRTLGSRKAMQDAAAANDKPTSLAHKIEQMLTEARVILPGVQALLGFQLAIVISHGFDELPAAAKLVHGVSLGLMALAVLLLMAPAAFHRIVYEGEDSQEFHRLGSVLVAVATLPLALGLAGDLYVVLVRITGASVASVVLATSALAALLGLWHVYPLVLRRRRHRQGGRSAHGGAGTPAKLADV